MDDPEFARFGRLFGNFLTHVVNRARRADPAESLVERISDFMGVEPSQLQTRPGVPHELIGVAGRCA